MKARFVAKGYSQHISDHIKETFAATPSSTSLRTLLLHAVLHQYQVTSCDISSVSLNTPREEDIFVQPPPEVYQHRPQVVWKLHRALYGLRTSPKMWQEHLHSTLRGMRLHQLKSDRCVWVKKNIIVLAYVDDLLIAGTSRDTTSFLAQFRQSFSLKHSTVLTSQQPLRFLGNRICRHPDGDIAVSLDKSYYYSMLKTMDPDDNSDPTSTPSLRRPPVQQDPHLDPGRHHIYRKVVGVPIWAAQVRLDLQFTAKDNTRHPSSPTEWDWQNLKHTLRYIKRTMYYKFLISPQLPQGHSLPLRQLIPLHSNTYCDSDWATDIDSRKCTSGTVTSVHEVPPGAQQRSSKHSRYIQCRSRTLCHRRRHQRQLTHIYQLLQELQHNLQRPTFDFGNLDTQYNFTTLTTTKPLTSSKLPIHIFTDSASALSLSN